LDDEQIAQPSMGENEAKTLIERVGGHDSILWDESAVIRETLRLPLFALIAALHSQTSRAMPRSRGTFIATLADSALSRTHRPVGETRQALMRLASLATKLNGPVPAAELGDEDVVRTVLASRLVVRKGKVLTFSLPVVEQHFAGQAILKFGLRDVDFEDLDALDRWRYPLVLAVTNGGWAQVNDVLQALARMNAGVAAWVVAAAVPDSGEEPQSEPPSELECARRLHQTLADWIAALDGVSEYLGLTNSDGRTRTVAVSLHNKWVDTALGLRDSNQPDAVRLPRGFNPFTGRAPDGSRWGACRGSQPPADFAAWPWRWSLDWISVNLESLLATAALPLPENGPVREEFMWALAKALIRQSNALHRPLDPAKVLAETERLLATTDAALFRFRGRLDATRKDLIALVDAIASGRLVRDGLIRRPYPAPDRNDFGGPGHVAELYTDETLRLLVEQVYANAFSIYQDLVDSWFPKLKGVLGLACLLPVLMKGSLIPGKGKGWDAEPDFAFDTRPLPSGGANQVEIALMRREDAAVDWETQKSQWREISQQIRAYRPGSEGWANPIAASTALSVFNDMPATAQAYRWLWGDLYALRLVKNQICPIRDN
jgi:hypothetical protein